MKSALICLICKSILKSPVFLPCWCTMCYDHVKDLYTQSNKDNIECQLCFKVSKVPECGLAGMLAPNMLATSCICRRSGDVFEAEKEFLANLDKSVKRFEVLRNSHTAEYAKYEVLIYDHFASLKRDIDLSREQIKLDINDTDSCSEQRKLKIDDSANKLIDRIEQRENEFKVMLLERKMDGMHIESVSVDEPFRNPKLVTKSADLLINELKSKHSKLTNIVNSFNTLSYDLKYCTFEANNEKRRSSNEIGRLTLKSLDFDWKIY